MLPAWLINELKKIEEEKQQKEENKNRLYIEEYEKEEQEKDAEQDPKRSQCSFSKNENGCWSNERENQKREKKYCEGIA
mgnify:CR=1 FL=1